MNLNKLDFHPVNVLHSVAMTKQHCFTMQEFEENLGRKNNWCEHTAVLQPSVALLLWKKNHHAIVKL